jgi:PPK2 family polyphosphate:nucleotide phosphotransferase
MSNPKHTLELARKISRPFRVTDGDSFHLRDSVPTNTLRFSKTNKKKGKGKAKKILTKELLLMESLQERLYAEGKRGVIVIIQALDAAGKDSTIKHVMSGINPQGCQVHSFKAPSHEELDQDFMRRCIKCLPTRGHIGIFNRSYYEEALVVRVHPEILDAQKLPSEVVNGDIWKQRFQDIRAFERYWSRNGFVVIKFFLHVSKKEQKRRFFSRVEEPKKNWKFSAADIHERGFWTKYQKAYEAVIRNTARKRAPWYVIPADHKWFTRVVVASALLDTLNRMNPQYPKVDAKQRKALAHAFHKDSVHKPKK